MLIADGAIGFTLSGTNYLETDPFAMLYDPATQFSAIGNNVPTDARALHTATLLADGRVLLAGGFLGAVSYTKNKFQGFSGDDLQISAEIFDPTDGTFTCVNGTSGMSCATAMTSSRGGHSATLLKSGPLAGMVLLAGGYGAPAKKSGREGGAEQRRTVRSGQAHIHGHRRDDRAARAARQHAGAIGLRQARHADRTGRL